MSGNVNVNDISISGDDDRGRPGTRLIMWCSPRTISSALTKCLSAIDGMEVWFEPWVYGRLGNDQMLKKTGRPLPLEYEGNEEGWAGASEIMSYLVGCKLDPERMPFGSVQKALEGVTSKHVFVKDMAYTMGKPEAREYLPRGYRHVFLMRHPDRTYNSYRIAAYSQLRDVGVLKGDALDINKFDLGVEDKIVPHTFFQDLHSLWEHVQRTGLDPNPVVFDADDLLSHPAEYLPKFCQAVGLPYSESLLRWDASTDMLDEWQAAGDDLLKTLVNFYEKAMKSSCFLPPCNALPRDQLTPDVIRLADEAMPFYEELLKYKI